MQCFKLWLNIEEADKDAKETPNATGGLDDDDVWGDVDDVSDTVARFSISFLLI